MRQDRKMDLQLITFDRTSAKDVLDKLRREIARIEGTTECESARDHAINAFWTAWHLHGWVWDAIKEQPELKAAVLKYRGVDQEGIDDQRAFGAALAGRFVPLKICRLIATSSKHVHVVLSSGSPSDVETEFRALDDLGGGASGEMQDLSTLGQTPMPWMPMVIIMGRPVVATRLLKEIDDYWVTLINECGIEQRQ